MADRTCTVCGTTHPLDKQHFRWRERDGEGYFVPECRSCMQKQKNESGTKLRKKKKDGLKRIEQAGVDLYVKSVQAGGSNIPHSAEVIERVFQYFGGVGGFAAMLVKQYYDAPPGSSARNRLLETLCRLVSKNVEQGGAKKPLTLWSEEELEVELDTRFKQAVAQWKGTTLNVEVQETPAAPEALPAGHPDDPGPDAVPEGTDQGDPERTSRQEARSLEAVPPEPEPREDSRQQGK